ncbi:hypothetical protein C8J57DRAFT_1493766 [Mycena rebaudengoi]|nr:hypothetical protein C8J57DRAFT_1493766 [Mycena rebaudengoi]
MPVPPWAHVHDAAAEHDAANVEHQRRLCAHARWAWFWIYKACNRCCGAGDSNSKYGGAKHCGDYNRGASYCSATPTTTTTSMIVEDTTPTPPPFVITTPPILDSDSPLSSPTLSSCASSVSSLPSVSSSFFFSSAAASPPSTSPLPGNAHNSGNAGAASQSRNTGNGGGGEEETLIIPSLVLPAPLVHRHTVRSDDMSGDRDRDAHHAANRRAALRLLVRSDADAAVLLAHIEDLRAHADHISGPVRVRRASDSSHDLSAEGDESEEA